MRLTRHSKDSAHPLPGRAGRQRRSAVGHAATAAVLVGLCAASPTFAVELIEQALAVAVRVRTAGGADVAQTIALTIVREAAAGRRPFLVLHHGRPADPQARAAMGRQTYPANSRYFASKGFVVIMPTRIGYGVSRGPDVEYTGECGSKHFAEGVAAAVDETQQVLQFVATLPYVDSGRGIIVGESFGGLVAIAAAASPIRGVLAAVNFSGGDGGDSLRHPDEPCRPDRLREMFVRYGAASSLPTLWLYSANDRLWGPRYPRAWHTAYTAAGGRATFIELPPDKNNGHFIFNRNAPAWHGAFEQFVSEFGLNAVAR